MNALTLDKKVQAIVEFLMSVALKDVSVMITLAVVGKNPQDISCKVKVVDLEPKVPEKIPRYFQLDQEIIQYYKLLLEHNVEIKLKRKCG